jgi:quercetin dioxygenase-like cupin family protein
MTDTSGPRWFFANLVQVKLAQATAGGAMSIVELVGPPGDMPPLHLHHTDDEAWYVLEGEMSFYVRGEQPILLAPGGLALGPRGEPHTYRVESSGPARWLAICTPGDFEPFVVAASHPAERAELPHSMARPARSRSQPLRLSPRSTTSSCSDHRGHFPTDFQVRRLVESVVRCGVDAARSAGPVFGNYP